jgi:hypothetical protein
MKLFPYRSLWLLLVFSFLLIFSACAPKTETTGGPDTASAVVPTPVNSSAQSQTSASIAPTETAVLPAATATPVLPTIWIDPALPSALTVSLQARSEIQPVKTPDDRSIRVQIGSESTVSQWVYVLVAPFPTVDDNVSSQDLKAAWTQGNPKSFSAKALLVSQNTLDIFTKLWGASSPSWVKVADEKKLVDLAWADKKSWSIVPFEQVEPRWKVISIDNDSPIQKAFKVDPYGLNVPISVVGPKEIVADYLKNFGPNSDTKVIPASNRDPAKMTTVVMTGVTALVRGTAAVMFIKGITYPDQDIRDWLREADITHISNEIPFTPKCPLIHNASEGLVFCTKPEFIGLLEDVNTKVVELTGDHFQDWGAEAMLYTLDMYNKRGWKYYGGGASLDDGRKPALFEHNGNKIAFLGCNGKAPGYAGASATKPGAVHCDMKYEAEQIKSLRAQGYNVIMTFQHEEVWTYLADKALKPDFEAAADAGATIVSGSQAHQPQALEFRNGSLVHYGLGNLFFDQFYEGLANRQAFIDRHVFYNGKYINTELLTMMFVDLARPRPMTSDERKDLLTTIFKASNW